MQGDARIATDHQLILEGLEVLRLISYHMEMDRFVEPGDIATVLDFLNNVGCQCLEHTEHLLLRPALTRAKEKEQIQRFRSALALHGTIRPLFESTAADVNVREHFVSHAQLFTELMSDLIFEEDHFLLKAAVDLLDDPEGLRNIETFAEHERQIRILATKGSPELHRLETKYVNPHCI